MEESLRERSISYWLLKFDRTVHGGFVTMNSLDGLLLTIRGGK
jgi:hypothetical protein